MSRQPSSPALRLACEQLAQSRQRLQQVLGNSPATLGATAPFGPAGPAGKWVRHLQSLPGVELIKAIATRWWVEHPYRVAAIAIKDIAKSAVLPAAQRHPLILVAGAFLVGGVLAWNRPWHCLPARRSGRRAVVDL